MKKIIPVLTTVIITTSLISGCSLFNKEDDPMIYPDATTGEETTVDGTTEDETVTQDVVDPKPEAAIAPYLLIDFDASYSDPYPLRVISFQGTDKLKVADASKEGSNQLDLFVMNLKDAISRKDENKLLSMISESVVYSDGEGKTDFTYHWALNENPVSSDIWGEMERILIYGGKLVYDDMYQIPYMYDELSKSSVNAACIGDSVNMRSEDSINGGVVDQLNFDLLTELETSTKTYTMDGVEYPWVKVQKQDGTIGYVVKAFIYDSNDFNIQISNPNGYWEITAIKSGQ